MTSYERGYETTDALTEVRTVLSRTETALKELERERAGDGRPLPYWQLSHPDRYDVPEDGLFHADRDIDDMIDALTETVKRLDRYRRMGRTRKGIQ